MRKRTKEHYIQSLDHYNLFCRHTVQDARKLTLVFIHGLGANWTLWKQEIIFFEKKGYNTLSFDLRGHGLSEIPQHEEDYFFENFGKDVYAVLKAHKIKRYILVSHSFGGGVALNYYGLYKANPPEAMIMIESTYRYPFEHRREFHINPFISTFLRFIAEHDHFRRRNFPHMKELDLTTIKDKNRMKIFLHAIQITPLKSILACIDAVQEYSFNHLQETEKLLTRIKIPVLVIAGSEDRIIPVHIAEEMHWLIKNSKLKIIMGAYHRVPLEKPDEVSQEILKFVARGTKH